MVTAIQGLVRGLGKAGVQVEIVTTTANEPHDLEKQEVLDEGAPVHFCKRIARNSFCYAPDQARIVEERIAGFDLVHIHGFWTYSDLMGCRKARQWDKPYLITPHGMLDAWALGKKPLKKKLHLELVGKTNLKKAFAVHCLTRDEERDINALFKIGRAHV
jgi:glycosyltransferase involved in cell wall biosynthesis